MKTEESEPKKANFDDVEMTEVTMKVYNALLPKMQPIMDKHNLTLSELLSLISLKVASNPEKYGVTL